MKNAFFIFTFLFHYASAQTFTALNSGTGNQLRGIDFATVNKGVAVGDGGKVIITSNGTNWVQRNSGVMEDLNDVKYINPTTIIAVGWGGAMIKSTDSGWNWSTLYPGGSYHLTSIYVNGTDLYATGQNGVIIKSTDEGDTWTPVNPGQGAHIFDVFFTSNTVGYAVGNDAYIHKTIDGGASWTTTYSFDSGISEDFQLRSVYFTDANNGYIVGKNLWANQSIFLRTTDGGLNWTSQIVYGADYVEIKFLDANTGFILGQNSNSNTGSISKTTNGGANWSYLSGFSKTQTSMVFSGFNVGYTCGFNGTIFKSTNISLGIDDLIDDQVISVYPNPSSEKIFINLDPSIQSESLAIEVYTISGDKMISQSEGLSVDITEIPSGSYLLKIKSESSVWTKRIIKNN